MLFILVPTCTISCVCVCVCMRARVCVCLLSKRGAVVQVTRKMQHFLGPSFRTCSSVYLADAEILHCRICTCKITYNTGETHDMQTNASNQINRCIVIVLLPTKKHRTNPIIHHRRCLPNTGAYTSHVSIRLRKWAIIWNSTGYHQTTTTNTKLCRSHRNTYTKVRTYHASVASSSLVAGSSTDTI